MSAPLAGIRIAVTRARSQAEELAVPLRALGATVVLAPLIQLEPLLESPDVRSAIAQIDGFDWVVFTSVNGVHLFATALERAGRPALAARVACVGPATAEAARANGFEPALVPSDYTGVGVAEALRAGYPLRGSRILLARAGDAGAELPRLLEDAGAVVSDVAFYRAVADPAGRAILREQLTAETLDVVTFTSGSSVRYFGLGRAEVGHALVAAIGPITADAAQAMGLPVAIQGHPNTVDGLVAAIVRHFGEKES